MKTKLLRRLRKRFDIKIVYNTLSTNKWLIKDKKTSIIYEKRDFYGTIDLVSTIWNEFFYFYMLVNKNIDKRIQNKLKQEFNR